MKKYIFSSVVLIGLVIGLFSIGNISYAKSNLTASEVSAIVEILKIFKVSDNDISRITNILKEEDISTIPQVVVPIENPLKPTRPYQYINEGCGNGKNIYNTVTGNVCPKYQTIGGAQA